MAPHTQSQNRVFLNIPYDKKFERLYVAYIVGLVEFGLTPVATLQIATGTSRIDRIYSLLRSCRYSIHDLSRVQSWGEPRLPRFNMPFELGMAFSLARQLPGAHTWIAFDSVRHQAQRTLSDLAGSDFNIHANTAKGVMRGLCSVFVRKDRRPSVPQMMSTLEVVRRAIPELKRTSGAEDIFEARMFSELLQLAQAVSNPSTRHNV